MGKYHLLVTYPFIFYSLFLNIIDKSLHNNTGHNNNKYN